MCRVLDAVVHEAMGRSLPELSHPAMELLKDDDNRRKEAAVEKEPQAGTGRAFFDTIAQLEKFANARENDMKNRSVLLGYILSSFALIR